MTPANDLIRPVRATLRQLYDPNALLTSPLVSLLGLEQERNPATRLREILITAINALEPDEETPEHARAWRWHEILLYRYVQQIAQQEVADQLGLGVRHLRREEVEAITALAHLLWQQQPAPVAHSSLPAAPEPQPSPSSPLEEILPGAIEVVGPLARSHRVSLTTSSAQVRGLNLCAPPTTVRQILINLLCAAVRQAPDGAVALGVTTALDTARLTINTQSASLPPLAADDQANLELTALMVTESKGVLHWSRRGGHFAATLTLPAFSAVQVLVIDDNRDTLRLLERYAVGSRYQVRTLAEPARAIETACAWLPQIIVLDVMMPQIDGWELLGRLRQHPLLGRTPVVVCSILAQEELARSLGAHGFIHKPVTRQAFMAALEQQAAPADYSRRASSIPA